MQKKIVCLIFTINTENKIIEKNNIIVIENKAIINRFNRFL